MSPLGKYLRWLCLLAFISSKIYFLVHGSTLLQSKEGEMAGIFICDESSNNNMKMTQCTGLDDVTTCNEIQCIQSSCGRPLFPHIGISYAGSSDPFDVNAATSTSQSFMTILSLCYSLVPYILLTYFIIYFLALGNIIPLTRLGLMGFVFLVNDALLKNIVKQPRPMGSCLYFHSFGMPSGHAATSIGLLTFILLELFLYHPDLYATTTSTCYIEEVEGEYSPSDAYRIFTWGFGWHRRLIESDGNNDLEATILSQEDPAEEGGIRRRSLQPSSNCIKRSLQPSSNSTLESMDAPSSSGPSSSSYNIIPVEQQPPRGYHFQSKWLHHSHALLWTILLMPVPLSRVYLHDHSPMQILVGSFVGITLGCIWNFIIRGCIFRSSTANGGGIMVYLVNCRLGKWIGLNFGVGRGRIRVRCN